jgi:type I restriction enzyme S subunit
MSSERKDTTIGDICTKVFSGGTPSSTRSDYYDGGAIPWLRTKEVNYSKIYATEQCITSLGFENSSVKLVPMNSVIVAMYGNGDTAGRVAINKVPLTTNQACCNLVVDPGQADYRYVYYYLMGQYKALVDLKNGGAQQNLNGQLIKAFPVSLPSVAVQSGIASFLEALDDRITLLRETNATLEAIAQALFKSWFVDFDPVRAKMAGRAPEGMDEATAALFPDALEETAHGLIPKGWAHQPIADMVEGVYDGPHATPPEAESGGVFLGIKNLTGTALDLAEIRFIGEAEWAKWTKRVEPRAGDIVFSYEATLGFFALIPPDLRCCLGRRLALIRPKEEDGAGHFWFHQFVAPPFQALLAKHTIQGATVNRIALKEFPSYSVLVPPLLLRTAFADVASGMWAKIQSNQAQAQTLAALRDTLLPRLISGQLRLPEAQAQLEAHLS